MILRYEELEGFDIEGFRKIARRGIQFYNEEEMSEYLVAFAGNESFISVSVQANYISRKGDTLLCNYLALTFRCGKDNYRIERGGMIKDVAYSISTEGDYIPCEMETIPSSYHQISDFLLHCLLEENMVISRLN